MTDLSERREAPRFNVTIPVRLNHDGTGITRDFSATGIYFETDKIINTGDTIEFVLVMEHLNPAQPTQVRYEAKVVRVERRKGRQGVAAALQSFRVEDVAWDNKTS